MKEEKESMLFKKLDLAFVYLVIFGVGIAIVFIMTAYINNKVQEFTGDAITVSENQ